ncbi:BZ3500_MvSof-1268-A1-R1_Chr1-1g00841 [Microbotryum saponariae]|uniref:BZ3500_MvSof-1268-A1-R1_Chr1-1g00841 protein n=1 Tax=Microbotryum saponariae TaxID=289078 RepID=A0A2X0M428_9BASI|nr:BZ3500_MvSof-1268-A1-R1_Chr1-1g00841 [Microbotryum saponariae]SCZ92763.1 BZ3501_MvSof-1269-A2-R1_Chr1-1g00438 [Microbotryum saponariae]
MTPLQSVLSAERRGTIDHHFFDCFDSKDVWMAARDVLCDALGRGTIEYEHFSPCCDFSAFPSSRPNLANKKAQTERIANNAPSRYTFFELS